MNDLLDECVALAEAIAMRCDDAVWKESDHPRQKDGKFGNKAAATSEDKPKKTPMAAENKMVLVKELKSLGGPQASAIVPEIFPVPPPKPTKDLTEAVYNYTRSSARLNARLRSGADHGMYKEQIEKLDAAMKDAEGAPFKFTVIRGIRENVMDNIREGQLWVDDGYMSTSFSEEVAKDFYATRLVITIPKGFKFLPIPSYKEAVNSRIPHAKREAEALLPRGTGLMISKIKTLSTGTRIAYATAVCSSVQPAKPKKKAA